MNGQSVCNSNPHFKKYNEILFIFYNATTASHSSFRFVFALLLKKYIMRLDARLDFRQQILVHDIFLTLGFLMKVDVIAISYHTIQIARCLIDFAKVTIFMLYFNICVFFVVNPLNSVGSIYSSYNYRPKSWMYIKYDLLYSEMYNLWHAKNAYKRICKAAPCQITLNVKDILKDSWIDYSTIWFAFRYKI